MYRPTPPRHEPTIALLPLLALLLLAAPGCGGRATSSELEGATGGPSAPRGSRRAPALPPRAPAAEPPRMETCEDNPLLAGCAIAPPAGNTCPDNPLACPVPPQPAGPRRSEDLSLPTVVRMEALLDEQCGVCHGAQARRACSGVCDGMTYIDDMTALLDTEKILPCNWRGSAIARRMRDRSMPPAYSGVPPMSAGLQGELEEFVEGMCAQLLEPGSLRRSVVEQALVESCGACHTSGTTDAGTLPGVAPRVDDLEALTDEGLVIPCRAQSSPLILAIQSGRMPPPESGQPPMSAEQLATLISIIDSPCAR